MICSEWYNIYESPWGYTRFSHKKMYCRSNEPFKYLDDGKGEPIPLHHILEVHDYTRDDGKPHPKNKAKFLVYGCGCLERFETFEDAMVKVEEVLSSISS